MNFVKQDHLIVNFWPQKCSLRLNITQENGLTLLNIINLMRPVPAFPSVLIKPSLVQQGIYFRFKPSKTNV